MAAERKNCRVAPGIQRRSHPKEGVFVFFFVPRPRQKEIRVGVENGSVGQIPSRFIRCLPKDVRRRELAEEGAS